jgi:hypothetical protein
MPKQKIVLQSYYLIKPHQHHKSTNPTKIERLRLSLLVSRREMRPEQAAVLRVLRRDYDKAKRVRLTLKRASRASFTLAAQSSFQTRTARGPIGAREIPAARVLKFFPARAPIFLLFVEPTKTEARAETKGRTHERETFEVRGEKRGGFPFPSRSAIPAFWEIPKFGARRAWMRRDSRSSGKHAARAA